MPGPGQIWVGQPGSIGYRPGRGRSVYAGANQSRRPGKHPLVTEGHKCPRGYKTAHRMDWQLATLLLYPRGLHSCPRAKYPQGINTRPPFLPQGHAVVGYAPRPVGQLPFLTALIRHKGGRQCALPLHWPQAGCIYRPRWQGTFINTYVPCCLCCRFIGSIGQLNCRPFKSSRIGFGFLLAHLGTPLSLLNSLRYVPGLVVATSDVHAVATWTPDPLVVQAGTGLIGGLRPWPLSGAAWKAMSLRKVPWPFKSS